MSGLNVCDEVEELTVVLYGSRSDICRTSYDMVAVGDSTYGGVQCRAAVARGDDDGCAVAAAYGVEELFYEDGEHLTCCMGWGVVDGQTLGGGAGGQFLDGEMLHTLIVLLIG